MATTIIDALLVTLGLDASAFDKGAEKAIQAQKKIEGAAAEGAATTEKQEKKTEAERKKRTTQQGKEQADLEKKDKDAREKRGKDVEAKAKQAAQGFSKIRNEALALFSVFTAGVGIKSFIENAISAAAGLDRMSANLGMSAEKLAEYQLANERAGGSVGGMTEQLKDASTELAKFSKLGMGSEKMTELFRWAGMAGVKINFDDLKTGTDVMLARANVLKALSDIDPARALVAASAMGVSEDTFNLLKQGSAAVIEQAEAQSKLAGEMARNAPGAEAFRKKWNDVSHEFQAMAIQVLPKLIPYLERFANWVINIIPGVERFAGKVDKVVESMGGWSNVLIALGALKLLSMTSGLIGLGQALVGVGTALGLIGGAAGVAALATLTGIGLLTASAGLNKGEDAELARRRKLAPTIDGPAGAGKSGAGMPRGMRNNNPGNIEYGTFAKKHGATGTDGRFAIFPTMEAGQAAMQALLGGYLGGGHNTVGKVINRWAPGFENNTAAYVAAVSKQIGVGPDQKLNDSHLPALAEAISRHENGAAWGRRNAEAAANMPMGAAAAQRGTAGGSNSTSTTDVRVGQITVNTQATDADGIAKSIGSAVSQYGFAAQMNTGMA
jgi:hypothetical protein